MGSPAVEASHGPLGWDLERSLWWRTVPWAPPIPHVPMITPQLCRSSRLERFFLTNLGAVTFLGLVGLQFISWTVGDDPATLAPQESLATSNQLSELRVIPVDEVLFLNDQSPYRWILGGGFGQPEADGTWITATEAVLEFTVVNQNPRVMRLSMSPFLDPGSAKRRVEIEASGASVVMDLVQGGEMFTIALDGAANQTVRIRCESLSVPDRKSTDSDRRALCAKLYAIEVTGE